MNILFFENEYLNIKISDYVFKKLLSSILAVLNFKGSVELSLFICKPSTIKKMNNKYRNKNKQTDVLSFPLNTSEKIDKAYGYKMLGDIFMCHSIIIKQAKENNNTLKWEYGYMFLHSVLHLFKYDHINKKKEKEMDLLIKKALLNLGYKKHEKNF